MSTSSVSGTCAWHGLGRNVDDRGIWPRNGVYRTKSIWQGPFTQAAEINKVDKSQNQATIWGITEQVPNDCSWELLWAKCYVLSPSHASRHGSLRRVHEIRIHFTEVETETEGDTGISPLTPEPKNVSDQLRTQTLACLRAKPSHLCIKTTCTPVKRRKKEPLWSVPLRERLCLLIHLLCTEGH